MAIEEAADVWKHVAQVLAALEGERSICTTAVHQRHMSWEGSDYENTFRFHQCLLKGVQQIPAVEEGTGLAALACCRISDSEDRPYSCEVHKSNFRFSQLFFADRLFTSLTQPTCPYGTALV